MKMTYRIILLLLVFFLPVPGSLYASEEDGQPEEEAETGPWEFGGFFSQQVNQISFSNWVRGGENSFASTSLVNLTTDYTRDRYSWENKLNLAYGITKTEDTPTRKNEDRIHLISKGGRNVSEHLSTSFLMEFRSQFDKGYNYPNDSVVVSRFMAPGDLSLSLGLDYKPWEFLSIFASPVAGKLTFVLNQRLADQGAFGVTPAEYDEDDRLIKEGDNVKAEFGTLLNFMLEKEVFEDVFVESRLSLFNDLTDDENRKNTDVDWETSINFKLMEYISATIMFRMIYEHDTRIPVYDDEGVETGYTRDVQIQQLFGLGFSYRF